METELEGKLNIWNGYGEFKDKNKTVVYKNGLDSSTYTDSDNKIIGYKQCSSFFGRSTYTDTKGNLIGISDRKTYYTNNGTTTQAHYDGERYKSIDRTKSGSLNIKKWSFDLVDYKVYTSGWNPMMEMLKLSKTKEPEIMIELNKYNPKVKFEFLDSTISAGELSKVLSSAKKYEDTYAKFFGEEKFKSHSFTRNMDTEDLKALHKLSMMYNRVLLPSEILEHRKICATNYNKLKTEYNNDVEQRKKNFGWSSLCCWSSKNKDSKLVLEGLQNKMDILSTKLRPLNRLSKYALNLSTLEEKRINFSGKLYGIRSCTNKVLREK